MSSKLGSSNGGGDAPAAPIAPPSPGVSKLVKLSLLIVLCLQNAVYTMLRRYSGGVLGEKWSKSSVLMMGEVIKLVFSMFMTLADTGASSADGTGGAKLWWLVKASPPMAVPAVVFWLMNLLSYVSLDRVDATTFTVCAQMKILTTAVFSVIMMGRTFHARKWRALVLLVLGVVLVSNGTYVGDDSSKEGDDSKMQYMIGVTAVVTEVTLSGFVSVFFEKVLKSRIVNLSVWDRNFQLAMYSIVFYFPLALREEGPFFSGWTINAVILSILGSAGGLLVALTMKYTDAVLKTFATSGAIIVTAVAGYLFLGAPLDVPIGVGAGCTVLSLLNYGDNGAPLPADSNGAAGGGGGEKRAAGGGGAAAAAPPYANGKAGVHGGGRGQAEDEEEVAQLLMTRTGTANDSAA